MLALCLLASAGTARSAEPVPPTPDLPANETLAMFANTCMSHFFSGTDLHARFDKSDTAVRWSAEESAKFLAGKPGAVWGIRGKDSNYAVTLLDSDEICSVSAETSDDAVWSSFDQLLKALFPGTELVPIEQEKVGPNTTLTRSKGYGLKSKGNLLPPIFTISTSKDPKAGFQARVTMFFPHQPGWKPNGAGNG